MVYCAVSVDVRPAACSWTLAYILCSKACIFTGSVLSTSSFDAQCVMAFTGGAVLVTICAVAFVQQRMHAGKINAMRLRITCKELFFMMRMLLIYLMIIHLK